MNGEYDHVALCHLGARAFDLIEGDTTTFAHATEDAAGDVEEVFGTIKLLEEK